jgi:hypothetical protein
VLGMRIVSPLILNLNDINSKNYLCKIRIIKITEFIKLQKIEDSSTNCIILCISCKLIIK